MSTTEPSPDSAASSPLPPKAPAPAWRLPLIVGAIALVAGLLIGSVVTWAVIVVVTNGQSVQSGQSLSKAPVTHADITSDNAAYQRALSHCGIGTSAFVILRDGAGLMSLESQADVDSAGPSLDDVECVVYALGASKKTVDAMSAGRSVTERFNGLQLKAVSAGNGVSVIVTPFPTK
jgi:hypothetical protein